MKNNPFFLCGALPLFPCLQCRLGALQKATCGALVEQITSRATSVCITRHLTCLCEDEKKAPRRYASLCHDKNPLQSIGALIADRFLGLLDTSAQQATGRSLLLHFESAELQHLHWRQDARNWHACTSFNEEQQWALEMTRKMGPEIFFHFVWLAQPHTYLCFPGLKGSP